MTGLHFWCSTVCLSSDRIHDDIQFFVSLGGGSDCHHGVVLLPHLRRRTGFTMTPPHLATTQAHVGAATSKDMGVSMGSEYVSTLTHHNSQGCGSRLSPRGLVNHAQKFSG
ncbi:hypothetical protein VPH35_077354 [Triticum aestivum]|uniref:Uncharacterized protein n=1 Tax=Aegilops tauschii TaxID=37682 RepID=M8BVS9_AEGTA